MNTSNGTITIDGKKREFKWLAQCADHLLENKSSEYADDHDLGFQEIQEAIKKSVARKENTKQLYICYVDFKGRLYIAYFWVTTDYCLISTMFHPSNHLERRKEEMKALKEKLKKPSGGQRNKKQSIDEYDINSIGTPLNPTVLWTFEQSGLGHIKTEEDLTEHHRKLKSKPIQLH
jgi:hypothetical protein